MNQRKHLIPQKQQYKAQLHIHTNLTDGGWSPEKLKECYKEKGYSIVAYSDHGLITKHPELNDPDFLAMTAYEFDIYEPGKPRLYNRMYHINFLSPNPDDLWQAFRPESVFPNIRHLLDQVTFGDCVREYSLEAVNRIIAESNARGFLATYNHPDGSYHSYPDYIGLEGLWGVEVYNHDCALNGFDEGNDLIYQDFLKTGKNVFPIASDDGHAPSKMNGGWTMVLAESLEYGEVFRALKNGDFYATTGPQIHDIWVEDGEIHLTCSEAATVAMRTESRLGLKRHKKADGAPLTEVSFDLTAWADLIPEGGDADAFVRLVVEDASGHKAWTRAYRKCEMF